MPTDVEGVPMAAGSASGAELDRWEVVIARYGRRSTTRSEVFLNHGVYGEADGPIGMDYFVWVVRNAESTFVIDTGFSRAGGDARGRETIVDPRTLYESLGVDPSSAPTVVVTHGHYDHIGNLNLFPDSPVVLARRELDFWTGPLRRKQLFHHSVEESELDHLGEVVAQQRATLFEGTLDLAPGIEVIEVGGHTPGQCMVRVNTTAGWVLLASDVVHYYEELELDRPFSSVANVADMYSGFARIRDMVAAGDVDHVVSGHDPSTLERFGRDIDPAENVVTIGSQR